MKNGVLSFMVWAAAGAALAGGGRIAWDRFYTSSPEKLENEKQKTVESGDLKKFREQMKKLTEEKTVAKAPKIQEKPKPETVTETVKKQKPEPEVVKTVPAKEESFERLGKVADSMGDSISGISSTENPAYEKNITVADDSMERQIRIVNELFSE